MYAQLEKPKENKRRAIANSVAPKKGSMTQGFGFVDNRPEVTSQRKMQALTFNHQVPQLIQNKENDTGLPDNLNIYSKIKAIQLEKSVNNITFVRNMRNSYKGMPLQRMKINEVEGGEEAVFKTAFMDWLRENAPDIFGGMSNPEIQDSLYDVDREEKLLRGWVNGFNGIGQTTVEMDAPLPESVTHRGEFVSFKTNVISGIDGMFDLWYYHRLSTVDVDVKLLVPELDPHVFQTLRAIEEYWTDKFHLLNEETEERIRVDINVIPTPNAEDYHFEFNDLTGSETNPSVIRGGRTFNTRRVEADAGKNQKSAFHEFGHVIGLGEDYNTDQEISRTGHHYGMLSEGEQEAYRGKIEGTNIPNSIMGQSGAEVQTEHYQPILEAFRSLLPDGQNPNVWIVAEKA